MHVEVSVAINFFISYLYNKLPRRRVDLFGEELEKGLKQKFEGHWYPDKPFKGSGFRCIRCNGDKVDAVISTAARQSGLDLQEVKEYVPDELTMWIDPSEVSYRINEKSPIKILYSDRHEDDGCGDAGMTSTDREVQNHTFNPDALSFQPIDSLSSSLSSLSLSPSSPVPPGAWSASVSPSAALLSSPIPSVGAAQNHGFIASSPVAAAPASSTAPVFLGKAYNSPQFTAATFAQTKFGSTKLKTQAKRPTRLSPTEMGNFFRQQQRAGFAGAAPSPQRPRSLSPRDPRLEFLIDQQQRLYQRGQLSPQGHQSMTQTMQQQNQQFNHQYQHQQQLTFPPCSSAQGPLSPGNSYSNPPNGSFNNSYNANSCSGSNVPWSLGPNDPWASSRNHNTSPHLSPNSGLPAGFPDLFSSAPPSFSHHSGSSVAGLHSPASSLSPPDGHKTFLDGLHHLNNVHHGYPPSLQHLLVAN